MQRPQLFEMTGQIDSQSASEVFDTLHKVHEVFKTTIILVTHDPLVSKLVDRVVAIRDGRTSTEIRRHRDRTSGTVDEEEWVILDQAGRLQLPKVGCHPRRSIAVSWSDVGNNWGKADCTRPED